MQYEAFLSYIQCGIQSFMGPDTKVSLHKIRKNNNLCLDGLTILPPGQCISPTIYLNAFYEDHQNGEPLSRIMTNILSLYEEHHPRQIISPELLQTYDAISTRIAYKLINYNANRPLLQTVPHIPLLDLAIVFYLVLDSNASEELTAMITNEHIQMWHSSPQTLFETAAHNTPCLYPYRCVSIDRLIQECTETATEQYARNGFGPYLFSAPAPETEQTASFCPEPPLSENDSSIPMYILTNHKRLNGATCLLYEHILDGFADQCGGDFFILPSSIHETILLPCRIPMEPERLKTMVRDMNAHEVSPWERLSDQIYRYDARQRQILICD